MSGVLRRLSRSVVSSAPPSAMSSSSHGKPSAGQTCLATWDDITESNYCEYLSMPSGTWLPSGFASDTVEHLLRTQFEKYLSDVEKAAKDCAAAVRRLVAKGPPVFLHDENALPLAEGDTHIEKVWFCNGDVERSAVLHGALVGEERDVLWQSQKLTLEAMELAEAAQSS